MTIKTKAQPANPLAYPNAGAPHHADGMTLRDHFAAIALPIIMQSDDWLTEPVKKKRRFIVTDTDLAVCAYSLADAMLKARVKRRVRK